MFEIRRKLVEDYRDFIRSFLRVRDEEIREFLDAKLEAGVLWPEPLLQLNPAFEPGRTVDELVEEGVLAPACRAIFRRGKNPNGEAGKPLRLFRHQERAIELAREGRNYVLTTGTGSGKSLSYMLPIVDFVLREGSGKGVRAVVIYPMNALANSQVNELEKYLKFGFERPPVTFARYTGQEAMAERDRILAEPPDILLTNFMMMELILTRPYEQKLVQALEGLRFLVLDELHTYRGRQGADVAMLVRRLRQRAGSGPVVHVGTSATLSTRGTAAEKRRAVAEVASSIFGAPVEPDAVVGETLLRWTPETDTSDPEFRRAVRASLRQEPPGDREAFRNFPLARWVESEIGLDRDDEGRLVRRLPRPLYGPESSAAQLAEYAGVELEEAKQALERLFLAASGLKPDPVSGERAFPVRLHQFFSPGVGVFGTLGGPWGRSLSLDGEKSPAKHPELPYFPIAFCRECGQHFFSVLRGRTAAQEPCFWPRPFGPRCSGSQGQGYLMPADGEELPSAEEIVPEDWFEERANGARVRSSRREAVPVRVSVHPDGREGGEIAALFVPGSLTVCPRCRTEFEPRESEYTKLSSLGLQGRSSVTTILSVRTCTELQAMGGLPESARKLLSFTDNRQDASLQSGHLNDFVQIGRLRSALYAAVRDAGEEGLGFDKVARRVFEKLALEEEEYAQPGNILASQKERREQTLCDVIGFRVFHDLRRGWRINAPNLEQVGLVRIVYPDLAMVAAEEGLWEGCHPSLRDATPAQREEVCRELLELLRKRLAIDVRYLNPRVMEDVVRRSEQFLQESWRLTEADHEAIRRRPVATLESRNGRETVQPIRLTPRGAFAGWLKTKSPLPGRGHFDSRDLHTLLGDLVRVLGPEGAGFLASSKSHGLSGYTLRGEAFRWHVARPQEAEERGEGPRRARRRWRNEYFESFYQQEPSRLRGIASREHTAQVTAEERQNREEAFRSGKLPILFCSPTMELGVDIADLNVVNLRNVPPTPANYAQRSGRAGRSGQPALVYTYCTAGSSHDQYYFRRPAQMVAGSVAPPRVDLENEDLLRAHIHAIWLEEAGVDLGKSLIDKLLDISGDPPSLVLRDEIRRVFENPQIRTRVMRRARELVELAGWRRIVPANRVDEWIEEVVQSIQASLDGACDRWRKLYLAAEEQQRAQNRIVTDLSASPEERRRAERLRKEAETQTRILCNETADVQSDFYVYRYLASEGFLPGYNFPRLPVSAYVPGDAKESGYLSRPRFLAISEFGPGAFVYHEGARYQVDEVMIPAEARAEDGALVTSEVKLCATCGFLFDNADSINRCESCGAQLGGESRIRGLLRLPGVKLRQRARITCDEEERMRAGYEIKTAVRYDPSWKDRVVRASLEADGAVLARMTYAPAATIHRINLGWKSSDNRAKGFLLDPERGRWLLGSEGDSHSPPPGERSQWVIPYVADRRNALILEWAEKLGLEQSASLQAALKQGIQAMFQIEDSELAAEPLPSSEDRRSILLFEAAEGGAGVLRRLVEDEDSVREVARMALELCHFDPETLEDRANFACGAACYDCLMSYGNQRDHPLLNRFAARDLLAQLREARLMQSPGAADRSEHFDRLWRQCQSDLERDWLRFLDERRLRLPSEAQYYVESCRARPDFVYLGVVPRVAVFVDGPVHDEPRQGEEDAKIEEALEVEGWAVHRFRYDANWEAIVRDYPSVYGEYR